MAWNELVALRGRGTKVFRDSANLIKHAVDAQAGTRWHYDSAPDAGDLANEVDLTPERVLAGGHDGWRIVNNGWHYFLGQPNGLADGFVGFGGRQGDRWLLFRLARVGYLHWPTRAWDDIGGAPTYRRGNDPLGNPYLSQQTGETVVNTTGQAIPVEAIAEWSDIWNTPGGGALDISWRADGNRLKEEITINDAARTWLAANRPPATPASETYFSFVFRLGSAPDVNNIQMDLSYLAKWLKNGIEQDTEGDFDDDDGTQRIEVRNALDEFLFFLPISEAYVDEEQPDFSIDRTSIKLRKRIYKDGSDYYLLVGAKVSDLVGLPSGDLVFDPTIDEQVDAGANNAFEDANNSVYDNGGLADVADEYFAAMWDDLTMSGTIDTAYVEFYLNHGALDEPEMLLSGEDTQTPAQYDHVSPPSSQVSGRALTTANVQWGDGTDQSGPAWFGSGVEAKTIIQELVDSYTYDGDDTLSILMENNGGGGASDMRANLYDDDSATAPKVHIEYTEAAGGEDFTIPIIMHHRRLIGAS